MPLLDVLSWCRFVCCARKTRGVSSRLLWCTHTFKLRGPSFNRTFIAKTTIHWVLIWAFRTPTVVSPNSRKSPLLCFSGGSLISSDTSTSTLNEVESRSGPKNRAFSRLITYFFFRVHLEVHWPKSNQQRVIMRLSRSSPLCAVVLAEYFSSSLQDNRNVHSHFSAQTVSTRSLEC